MAKAPAARPAAQAAPRPVNASTLLGATVRPAGRAAIRPAPGHQRLVVPAGARATRPASILPRPATLPVQTAPGKLLLKDLRKTPAKPAVVTGVHQVSTLR